ncbi:MAG: hypothetical protein KF773_20840 [Deltaproteobacteria bacterium]|nr:hypothetical protein [Deltaproteobacteria bacterium]
MKRMVLACGLALLGGCPPKRGGGGPVVDTGVGCPPASGVYVASFQTPDEDHPPAGAPTAPPKGNWVLPLADKIVPSLEGVPAYATIDAAAASAAGVPAPPTNIWLLAPGAAAPCRATIGAYYAASVDEGGEPNMTYGVELAGCPAPPDPNGTAIALVSDAAPTECKAIAPRQIAQRLSEPPAKEGDPWKRPTRETPIPEAIAGAIPARACAAPGCEKLYAIGQVDVGGKPVAYGAALNYMTVPDGAADRPCDWTSDDTFAGFFVVGPSGAPVRVTEGQDHPLALTAVLADRGGPKVLLAEGPGEYTAYALDGGTARVGRHLVWYLPHPDAYAIDRLGPDCSQPEH